GFGGPVPQRLPGRDLTGELGGQLGQGGGPVAGRAVRADRLVMLAGRQPDLLLRGGQVGGRLQLDVQGRVGELGVDGGGFGFAGPQGFLLAGAPGGLAERGLGRGHVREAGGDCAAFCLGLGRRGGRGGGRDRFGGPGGGGQRIGQLGGGGQRGVQVRGPVQLAGQGRPVRGGPAAGGLGLGLGR